MNSRMAATKYISTSCLGYFHLYLSLKPSLRTRTHLYAVSSEMRMFSKVFSTSCTSMTIHMRSSKVCNRPWGIRGPDKSLTDMNSFTRQDSAREYECMEPRQIRINFLTDLWVKKKTTNFQIEQFQHLHAKYLTNNPSPLLTGNKGRL